jgi:hypothetical protein
MPGTISQYQVVIAGQLITASLWNGMELNIINNGLVPSGIDDYSTNDAQMQTQTDPYPASATSRPTSLQGELERLRYQFDNIIGKTYWYEDPDVDIATFKTRFDAHTHDGTSNNGPQIAAAGLASDSVITAKILDSNVTTAKINDLAVTTAKINDLAVTVGKIADAAVDSNKIAASVAGNGLAGGAGTALSVNVDGSTLEINSDALRVKDSGITTAKIADTNVTEAKLATAVVNKLGQNIGLTTVLQTSSTGTIVNYSGQGRLLGCFNSGSSSTLTITIDGVVLTSEQIVSGECLDWSTGTEFAGVGVLLSSNATGKLNSIQVLFKTSLVISKTGGGTVTIVYERAA